jgi:hypothetical protein
MANLPTSLGKLPYTAWQSYLCMYLKIRDFSRTFFVYKFFYKSFYKFFYKGSHTLWRGEVFMNATIHEVVHNEFMEKRVPEYTFENLPQT